MASYSIYKVEQGRYFWTVWDRNIYQGFKPHMASYTKSKSDAKWCCLFVANNELHDPNPTRLPGSKAKAIMEDHDKRSREIERDTMSGAGEGRGISKKAILASLNACKKWVEKHTKSEYTTANGWYAENILVGCFQTCDQTKQRLDQWLNRKDRRKLLTKLSERYYRPGVCKVMIDLINLTRESVKSATWTDSYWVGTLPIRTPPKVTSKQKENLK